MHGNGIGGDLSNFNRGSVRPGLQLVRPGPEDRCSVINIRKGARLPPLIVPEQPWGRLPGGRHQHLVCRPLAFAARFDENEVDVRLGYRASQAYLRTRGPRSTARFRRALLVELEPWEPIGCVRRLDIL